MLYACLILTILPLPDFTIFSVIRMPKKDTHLTVFFCHASEDKPQVRKLYKQLTKDGIDIWFDEERLLPGQDWDLEISRALRSAHAIIVCLSNQFVNKEGYVQKEIKKAFAIAEEKPDGELFIIPVRLEDFPVPERFSSIQYVDIHGDQVNAGYQKIIASLAKRAGSLGLELKKKKELDHSPDIEHEVTVMLKTMMRGGLELQEELQHLSRREPNGRGWLHNKIRDELLNLMGNPSKPATERAKAGDVLAWVGDPRFRADAWFLPDDDLLGYIKIPAGTFLMGRSPTRENPTKRDDPSHIVNLSDYHISRFPVTVAQYNLFLREKNLQTKKELDNHPVVDISWNDAMLYCEWLTEKLRNWPETPDEIAILMSIQSNGSPRVITLPSEAQWEKAARGIADERIYPWGSLPDPNRANYENTGLGKISAVGCFAEGASQYGVQDMSGNVCEWTRTNWGFDIGMPKFSYPYDPLDGREDTQYFNMLKVHRGGSFYDLATDVRCSSRGAANPNIPYGHIGFRLALAPLIKR